MDTDGLTNFAHDNNRCFFRKRNKIQKKSTETLPWKISRRGAKGRRKKYLIDQKCYYVQVIPLGGGGV